MKRLLLLGGSRYLMPVLREAKALGATVMTCDYLPENYAHRYADKSFNVSIIDREAVLRLAEEQEIDGIMSFACDPGVVTAAYVAEKLGLPAPGPLKSVEILQDKGKFRSFLRDHGFTCPQIHLPEKGEIPADLRYPLIVKPTDCAGSKGVTRVDRPEELAAAVERAERLSLSGRVILEEFITKRGFSSDTDCFSIDGRLCYASFNNQYFDQKAENPYAPMGYTWPSTMPAETQKELRDELQRLLSLLNMKTSLYNVETRMGDDGRAFLMEVAPRGGGNRLSEMLEKNSSAPLIRAAVEAALGLPVEEMADPVYRGHYSILMLHADHPGRFCGLDLKEEYRAYVEEEDLWVETGDEVGAFTGANQAIGSLVMNWPDERSCREAMGDPSVWLRVLVEEDAHAR